MFRYIIYILLFAAILSCGGKNDNVQQKKQEATNQNTHYDLDEIEESGEIIAVTMYGRNTYYDYHGKETGIAYEMLQNFAKGEGMGETASDTAAMIKMLKSGEADIILSPLTKKFADTHKLIICGMGKPKGADAFGWAVRKDQPELAAALNSWYKPGMEKRGITLEYTPAALAAIVQEAGSRFGARDLRRVVRKRVEDPVAEKLIAGEPISHLLLDAEGGKLLLQNKDQ